MSLKVVVRKQGQSEEAQRYGVIVMWIIVLVEGQHIETL